jgi:hypothetical protein
MTEEHIDRLIKAILLLVASLDCMEDQLASIAAHIEGHNELLLNLSYRTDPGGEGEARILRVSTDY